jgi:phospholipid transport system substrate-binding protein
MMALSSIYAARSIGRRALIAGLFLAATLPTVTLTLPARAESLSDAKDPAVFIDLLGQEAIQSLTAPDLTSQERRARFRELLHRSFNVPGIARFVLGHYWNEATEEERCEYLKLFEELIVTTYADRFSEYKGEKFAIAKVVQDRPNYATVHTLVDRPSAEDVRVDWRLRQEGDGSWRVIDLVVEGVSMSITQRSEFASVIQSNGGKVRGLIESLRKKVKSPGAEATAASAACT